MTTQPNCFDLSFVAKLPDELIHSIVNNVEDLETYRTLSTIPFFNRFLQGKFIQCHETGKKHLIKTPLQLNQLFGKQQFIEHKLYKKSEKKTGDWTCDTGTANLESVQYLVKYVEKVITKAELENLQEECRAMASLELFYFVVIGECGRVPINLVPDELNPSICTPYLKGLYIMSQVSEGAKGQVLTVSRGDLAGCRFDLVSHSSNLSLKFHNHELLNQQLRFTCIKNLSLVFNSLEQLESFGGLGALHTLQSLELVFLDRSQDLTISSWENNSVKRLSIDPGPGSGLVLSRITCVDLQSIFIKGDSLDSVIFNDCDFYSLHTLRCNPESELGFADIQMKDCRVKNTFRFEMLDTPYSTDHMNKPEAERTVWGLVYRS